MHQEVLTKEGLSLFINLKKFEGYYLAGGTALALQIGHRISVDFDLFSNNEIPKNLLTKVKQVFEDKEVVVSINNKDELTVFVAGVKITFLFYPFPPQKPLLELDGLKILDQTEIAGTKAYTVGRRGSLKDYLDLYFILSEKIISLEEIIKLAEEKFGTDFNSRLFLEQLVYLNDVEETEIIFLGNKITKAELFDFFSSQIKNFSL